jgi:hypothetical protein
MVTPALHAWDRILDAVAECLTRESAERLVRLRLDPETQARLDHLADKANEGLLSDDERAEYASFVDAIDVLGVLQGKAEQILVRRTGS